MSKHNYDIFISYRKRCSGDKPEMLQLMLEESGFRKRVSFDKDNLNGRFDVELIRRIDECKDFIMFMVPETFTTIRPLNEEAVETGEKATWDMEEVAFYERMASLTYEEFETEIKQLFATGKAAVQCFTCFLTGVEHRFKGCRCLCIGTHLPSDGKKQEDEYSENSFPAHFYSAFIVLLNRIKYHTKSDMWF
jgi:hypothetical protein